MEKLLHEIQQKDIGEVLLLPGKTIVRNKSRKRKKTSCKKLKTLRKNRPTMFCSTDCKNYYREGSKRKICWLGENQGYAERRNKKSKMWFGKQFGSSQGSQIKKQRSEQSVVLCASCHLSYHRLHDYHQMTLEQFMTLK